MRVWRLSFLLASVVAVVLCATATTVKPMSIEELTEASTSVVHARALESHSEWNAEHTLIYTFTKFQLINVLKGQTASEFVVRQMGGHAEGYTQKVSGVREWFSGEEVVLFLRPSEASGMLAVTGLFQGNFSVNRTRGEALVSNGVAGVSVIEGGTTKGFHGEQMTLRQLQQAVARASGGTQ